TPEVAVSFGTVAASADLDALERELAEKSELTQVLRAGADTQLQYLVFLCHRSAEEACQEVLKEYGFSRAALRGWTGTAAENDKRLEAGQAEAARTLEEAIAAVVGFAPRRAALELCLDRAVQEIAREEAKSRLLDSGTAFYLDGWVPVPEEEKLLRKLGEFTCCWETSDPAPEDYPVVPVKLKSNAITEPLTTITEMYSLPAYDGVDPNGLMAPFYIFFFGFMFADLGYGLLLAGACLFIRHKVRPKGGFGQLIRLMTMCGVSSAVIGLLTGGFSPTFWCSSPACWACPSRPSPSSPCRRAAACPPLCST
ncbi:MAG: V-type ATPase 116kDa subunit family protein, partial [Flavonifractor plautii]